MYAVIRESASPGALTEQVQAGRAEFEALRARQPGFRGSLTVDLGDGKRAIVGLWEDRQAHEAAAAVLGPQAERLTGAVTRIVYQGEVSGNDLTGR
jgi:hypothetical protein